MISELEWIVHKLVSSESEAEVILSHFRQETETIHCVCKAKCQRCTVCPCKSAGMHCSSECHCGTHAKPCKNRVNKIGVGITC